MEGVRVVMVQLASVCINQMEAVLNFRGGNYLDQQGEQRVRVRVKQGKIIMVYCVHI